jgi:hypothetical protein
LRTPIPHFFEKLHFFVLEDLHGIGFELIVARKPQIETDHAQGAAPGTRRPDRAERCQV